MNESTIMRIERESENHSFNVARDLALKDTEHIFIRRASHSNGTYLMVGTDKNNRTIVSNIYISDNCDVLSVGEWEEDIPIEDVFANDWEIWNVYTV